MTREMDAKVAELMGLKVRIHEYMHDTGMPSTRKRPRKYKVKEYLAGNTSLKHYSTDIAAAYAMEERIAELGLVDEYCMQLNAIANTHWEGGERQPQRWQLIHATPEDRCRAALKAVEEK